MRKLSREGWKFIILVALAAVFILGVFLGASVQEGIHNTLAAVGR